MTSRYLFLFALMLVVALGWPRPAEAQQRVALVVGNAAYGDKPLANPVRDARLLAAVLKDSLGFDVVLAENAGGERMLELIERFRERARGADAAVFYFSGHGMQDTGKRNYLIPVDARIGSETALRARGVQADEVAAALVEAAPRVSLVILDACRDSPFSLGTKSGAKGLGRMDVLSERELLIAFATRDGELAQDGAGANSPYAAALARQLAKAGQRPLLALLDDVADEVKGATDRKQRPVRYGDLRASTVLLSNVDFRAPRPREECADCPEMVAIPAGSFTMGSPVGEAGRVGDEDPQHAVRVGGFHLGRHEVTVGEFRRFVQATGYRSDAEKNAGGQSGCSSWDASHRRWEWRAGYWDNPGFTQSERHPVVCVSWHDAQAYISWLNDRTGRRYRLPSEAEWEYAARAGTQTSRFWGDDPDAGCRYANVADATQGPGGHTWDNQHRCRDGQYFTAAVGSYQDNPFGLKDMLGNVWEWTQDCWHDNYFRAPNDGSARTSGSDCGRRMLRGGSWLDVPRSVRSAVRFWNATGNRDVGSGFRLAKTVP